MYGQWQDSNEEPNIEVIMCRSQKASIARRGVESHESGPTTGQWASVNQNTTIATIHMSAALSVWVRNLVRRMAIQSRIC